MRLVPIEFYPAAQIVWLAEQSRKPHVSISEVMTHVERLQGERVEGHIKLFASNEEEP